MSATIILPRILQVGKNASEAVATIVRQLGCERPLLITDNMMVELGYITRLQALLAEAGIASDVFADTVPEPTVASIEAGVRVTNAGRYDCLIALGGGSPIDSAKAIAILARHGGAMG